ncbi:unnamed protein product [Gemmataceae bacterium]|nr:unnamed protein product [Gemmataceae bacterium]VTT98177.1 unnamed protein product [Gemmataceae bacterium]
MVIPAASIPRQGLRTADGEVFAYVVHADELARMQAEIATLREQLATAISQRDHHLAKREELLKTYFPLLPTPEEMSAPQATSEDMAALIAELEATGGR